MTPQVSAPRFRHLLFSAGFSAALLAVPAAAQEFPIETGTDDFRLSTLNTVDQLSYGAELIRPKVAVNPAGTSGVAVWPGDDLGYLEIFIRVIDLESGTAVGGEIPISQNAVGVSVGSTALDCDWELERCLVVWRESLEDDASLVGVFVDANTGAPNERPLPLADFFTESFVATDVTFSPALQQYLVTWGTTCIGNFSNFTSGTIRATALFAIFDDDTAFIPSPPPGETLCIGSLESIYDDQAGAYLTTWAESVFGRGTEIYAQYLNRANPAAARQISLTGGGDPAFNAESPTMAYDPGTGRTLVVWSADGNGNTVDGKNEIYGQLLEASTAGSLIPLEVGPDDFRISVTSSASLSSRDAFSPAVALDRVTGRFLVSWEADSTVAGLANNHYEIFAQGVRTDGTFTRDGELQVSTMGAPSSASFDGLASAVAAANGRGVVLWRGSETVNGLREEEVWGQVVTLAATANLSIAKTDNQATFVSGEPLTYTITVASSGPDDVTGARVVDVLPVGLGNATWTCTAEAGGTCPLSGAGNIDTTVDLPSGASAVFSLTATTSSDFRGSLINNATVTAPEGLVDPQPDDNTATDRSDSAALFADSFE
ncbi:MAG: DUF11 domain-containing protein [Pseudomonadota bacterium]